jgi:hypothetical protein
MTKSKHIGAALALFFAAATAAAGCAKKEAAPLPNGSQRDPAAASAAPALVDPEARAIAIQKPSYPIETCVVCGEALASKGAAKDVLHEGRLVRFCCDACAASFASAPAVQLEKIDAAIIAAQKPGYPLPECPIEGAKLGSMGDPVNVVIGTRLVQLCCADCEAAFRADPTAALAKVDAAYMNAQRASYPTTECALMEGMALDAMGEPFELMYGTRLVRLCCDQCVDKFWENPEAAIAAIDGAKTTTGTETSGG